jgi:two-component system phosphate regulon sensor histidine kinase PhoR
MLLYHLRNLYALIRWLQRGDGADPPRAFGAWDRLHALLQRGRRESARREAGLAAALGRWQEAARAMPEGVVMLDHDRIAWCNDAARVHLEIDPAKDEGRPITHLVRVPAFSEYLEARDFTQPVLIESGERVISVLVVPYGEGRRLALSRDITRFQKVDRVRREFVANVSHELRTPLTAIRGYVETLLDTPPSDPEDTRQFLTIIDRHSERLSRLTEDLLILSDLESGRIQLALQSIAPNQLIQRVLEIFWDRAAKKDIQLVHDATADVPKLQGDSDRLQQLFINLADNAIKYTPAGGTVMLTAARSADNGGPPMVEISVRDTGPGIPDKDLPRLTERFYRVDRARSRDLGGTGLGLAIVKHIVQAHQGELKIESTISQGTTVRVRLPMAQSSP